MLQVLQTHYRLNSCQNFRSELTFWQPQVIFAHFSPLISGHHDKENKDWKHKKGHDSHFEDSKKWGKKGGQEGKEEHGFASGGGGHGGGGGGGGHGGH